MMQLVLELTVFFQSVYANVTDCDGKPLLTTTNERVKDIRVKRKEKRAQNLVGMFAGAACDLGFNREWLIDSGATYNMIGRDILTSAELQNVRNIDEPIELGTANGDVKVTECLDIHMAIIGRTIRALIMDCDMQPILSMAKLVDDFNYRIAWDHQNCILISPEGIRIYCDVHVLT